MAMNKGWLTCGRDEGSDEVITPCYAVMPLLKYIPKNKVIWCPCDEEWSAYVQILKEKGYKVLNSCLAKGQDFFTYEPEENWDIIITNPPFSKKDKIIKRCYELGKPFAILLPMNSLQGQARFKLFSQGIEMLAFDKRVDYHTNGNLLETTHGNHFASAYYCKDILKNVHSDKNMVLEELIKYDSPLICPHQYYLNLQQAISQLKDKTIELNKTKEVVWSKDLADELEVLEQQLADATQEKLQLDQSDVVNYCSNQMILFEKACNCEKFKNKEDCWSEVFDWTSFNFNAKYNSIGGIV